jgi:hypothetical protein
VWRIVRLAARAAVWRRTPNPPRVGLPILLGIAVAATVLRVALQLLAAESWHAFNPYGLNAVVAWVALELAVAALFVRPACRATALSALLVLSIIGEIAAAAIKFAAPLLAPSVDHSDFWTGAIAANAVFAVILAWWIGAMVCVVGSFEPQRFHRLAGRVAGLALALFIADALVPHAPVFLPADFDARTANWWEVFYALRHDRSGEPRMVSADLVRLEKAQAPLLHGQITRLAPQRQGVTDIYALGIAGWADQDVFIKELDGGLAAIAGVLPIKDRTVRLVNSRATLDIVPLADVQNFKAAVHGIAAIMDRDEDVLVLMMTSHGDERGFMLQVPGRVVELTPEVVAATLDGEGIKNRVVVVSACYSGSFVPALKNDNTVVMTAADAKSTSFGCAPERDWTYFGDAFFRQSLHPGADLENAFDHARVLIEGWELMDRVPPSNPQGHFGQAVVEKLAPYFATNAGQ